MIKKDFARNTHINRDIKSALFFLIIYFYLIFTSISEILQVIVNEYTCIFVYYKNSYPKANFFICCFNHGWD